MFFALILRVAGKIQRLKLEEAGAQDRAGGLSEHLAAERKAFTDKQAEIARLTVQAGALPGDLETVRAKEEAVKEQLSATRAEYELKESEVRYQLNELTRGLSYYEKMGLAFEKVHDDRVRVVFTQLDPAAPERRCTFCIYVTEPANEYEVTEVEPSLPSLPSLVADLNTPDDLSSFSRFVQRMRQEFKAALLVEHGMQ